MAKNKKTEAPVPEDVEAETAQAPEEVPEGADTPGPVSYTHLRAHET